MTIERAVAATEPTPPARIASLDTTRGLALLGIMLVNVHYFTGPLASFSMVRPEPSGAPVPLWLDDVAFVFSRALFEGKFFPLYSLLFGAGMVLILEKVAARNRRFWAVFLRRLAVLAVIGLAHGLLIWYGDILFVYALLGVGLMLLAPYSSGRTLCIIGASLISVGMVLSLGCLSLQSLGNLSQTLPPLPESIASLPPGERLLQGMGIMQQPHHPEWIELEREAYAQGPYAQALIVRALSFVFSVGMSLIILGPTIGGMFMLGAGLMKGRFWSGGWTALHRRLLWAGLGVGLPVSVASVLIARLATGPAANVALAFSMAFGPVLTLGIAAGVIAWVRSGRAAGLARLLAVPGRMGLTNYLLTSVLMTLVAYHFGLGLWGTFGSAEQVALCVAVFAVLVTFSKVWMSRFVAGPVEWVWKCLTYLRLMPLALGARGEQSAQ
ncbi:MAG: DUF418 domain-containing protein [Phycisphaerales bacterium]|nr:DUF418 domain-containing protein [Phycisphaerales bacterium]